MRIPVFSVNRSGERLNDLYICAGELLGLHFYLARHVVVQTVKLDRVMHAFQHNFCGERLAYEVSRSRVEPDSLALHVFIAREKDNGHVAENRIGPNGMFIAAGPQLMRMKAHYNKDVMILCDANVKHTFALAEQPLDFTVESLIEGGADGIIVTGITTGVNPSVDDVIEVNRVAKGLPVFLGSGINEKNVNDYLPYISGAIVGSSLKKDRNVNNPVDVKNVKRFMSKIK